MDPKKLWSLESPTHYRRSYKELSRFPEKIGFGIGGSGMGAGRELIKATNENHAGAAVIDPPHTNGKIKPATTPVESLKAIVDGLPVSKGDPEFEVARDQLHAWLARELSPEGLLIQSPSRTLEVLVTLSKVRGAWAGRSWKKSHESVYKRVMRAVCQLGVQEGDLSCASLSSQEVRKLEAHWDRHPTGSRWERLLAHRLSGKVVPDKVAAPCKLGIESDELKLAVLRSDWNPDASRISVDFSKPAVSVEMHIRNQLLLHGRWMTRVFVDGNEASPLSSPENICWNSDEDGQYCELRQAFENDVVLERQIFLSRHMGLALISDALQCPVPARLRLDAKLPSPVSVTPAVSHATRTIDTPLETPVRFIPLGLPTHRWERADGDLSPGEGGYQLTMERNGRALACPLIILWGDKLTEEVPRAWRSLTVTNDRRVVPSDEAVAFRFVADGKQLLFFRSLVGRRRFAFVGHQTFLESLLGKVTPKGKVKEWLTVDRDEDTDEA